jgi:hypothetical protein
MTTAAPSTALATIQPSFTDAERLALAGFLAGYRGLTREAYALDLRQFTCWCRTRSLALFAVRRVGIEGFARDLEARGRARATVTRRLCTQGPGTLLLAATAAGGSSRPQSVTDRGLSLSANRLIVFIANAEARRPGQFGLASSAWPGGRACQPQLAGAWPALAAARAITAMPRPRRANPSNEA